jgi:hypothetical protein
MYAIEDFELLERLVAHFACLITTPHVLTETSNLVDLYGKEGSAFHACFKGTVGEMHVFCEKSVLVVQDTSFEDLGLADAGISLLSRRLGFLVLTDDLNLHLALAKRGVDTLNFNHIRTANWRFE